jgi:hypothetical protein
LRDGAIQPALIQGVIMSGTLRGRDKMKRAVNHQATKKNGTRIKAKNKSKTKKPNPKPLG